MTRRRGHVRERRPGVWEVIASGGGRHISRTVHGTKDDAERRLLTLQLEVSEPTPDRSVTVGTLLDVWTDQSEWSPTTERTYLGYMENHIRPALGDLPLVDLTGRRLDRLYASLSRSGKGQGSLSPSSVRQVHAILRRACEQARKWGWIDENPADRATPPRVAGPDIQPPSAETVAHLIDAAYADDPQLGAFIWLATVTGARRGELCALRWSHIDLDAGTVLIERSIVHKSYSDIIEKGTKTDRARKVSVDAPTVAVLREHKAAMLRRVMAFRLPAAKDPYVFSDSLDLGKPLVPDHVSRRWETLCKHEGIHYRLHDLRHFAATQALAAGIDVRTVSGRLGHADAHTTLNRYGHFLEAADRKAAEVLGGVLERARGAS